MKKMEKLKILVLTDHTNHSKENSIYALLPAMHKHPMVAQLDVATRGEVLNNFFFNGYINKSIFVSTVDENFAFTANGAAYKKRLHREYLKTYDVIWLRMPPPIAPDFLQFLKLVFSEKVIINDPFGIHETGSKEFLINFRELCPPIKVCRSLEDISEFKNLFPIVLKPFREYGGKGIVKIQGDQVWQGNDLMSYTEFSDSLSGKEVEYLGVKYLKNVSQGDKRIIVVNGKIIGASLRLPANGSWLCNVAQGGRSILTKVDEEEIKIVERVNIFLSRLGIVMYGVDTLVGDDGRRVLSELNTTSIGGVPQMAKQTGLPLVEETVNQIIEFVKQKINEPERAIA